MPMMAYSPLGRGELLEQPLIRDIANRHSASPAQVALAAVLRHDGVIAIPKASSVEHVEANADALDIHLTWKTWNGWMRPSRPETRRAAGYHLTDGCGRPEAHPYSSSSS